jgi:hypothetical protein
MTLRSTVLFKETRPIIAAWCLVTIAATTPSFLLYKAGFWIGLPLLATLAFGYEFQQRTLLLLLSQPMERMRIWNTKWIVASVAVISSAALYGIQQWSYLRLNSALFLICGAWLILAISSSAFWTLVAKSTIGGLALTILNAAIVGAVAMLLNAVVEGASWDTGFRIRLSIILPVALGYSAFMIWLGRRKFARFEATGTFAGDDVLVSHPRLTRPFLGWLRCRPSGAVRNLLRKEIRVLWPVWLFTIVCVVLLAFLSGLQVVLGASTQSSINIPNVAVAVVALYGFLVLLLGGSVALGEEKALGARSWQLTLPISSTVQWLVKVLVVFLGTFIGLLVVVNSGRWVLGKPFVDALSGIGQSDWVGLLQFATLSIAAFWTASAVNGTVRAILWTIPAVFLISEAPNAAEIAVQGLRELGIFHHAATAYHTISFKYDVYGILIHNVSPLILIALALLLLLLESRRLFPREIPDNWMFTLRTLIRPALAIFFVAFVSLTLRVFAIQTWDEATTVFNEVHQDTRRLGLDLTGTDAAHPRQLTATETERVLSTENTRRWLGKTRISVFAGTPLDFAAKNPSATTTIFELPNGLRCTTSDLIGFRSKTRLPWGMTRCRDSQGNDVAPWR